MHLPSAGEFHNSMPARLSCPLLLSNWVTVSISQEIMLQVDKKYQLAAKGSVRCEVH